MTFPASGAVGQTAPELTEFDLKVSGLNIHGRRSDHAPHTGRLPVVMVHGQGVSSEFEAPSARALAREFRVLVPDQPGFGKSEHPKKPFDVDQLADFFADFMSACGLERVALVATSFGCQVAVACAIRHPEKVAKVVLQGPAAAPRDRGALKLVHLWWQNGRQEPSDLGKLLASYRAAGFSRVLKTFNYYRHYPLEERLPLVRQPTLVVRGDRDKLVAPDWADRVSQLLPNGRLVIVPGAAHTMSHFWPRELADVSTPFLLENTGTEPLNNS